MFYALSKAHGGIIFTDLHSFVFSKYSCIIGWSPGSIANNIRYYQYYISVLFSIKSHFDRSESTISFVDKSRT